MILGIKCGEGHDSGAALLYESGGELRCVAQSEERFSRRKNDGAFPNLAIEACLGHVGATLEDVRVLAFDKLGPGTATDDFLDFENIESGVVSDEERRLRDGASGADAVIVNHHLAHAASAFCVQEMSDAAVLVIDGSGTRYASDAGSMAFGAEGLIAMGAADEPDGFPMAHYPRIAETQSMFTARRDHAGRVAIDRVAQSLRSGLGHFYTYFSRHVLGFSPHQEGKAMGLAAFGDPARAASLPVFPDACFAGIDTPLLQHCIEIGFRPTRRPPEVPPTDPMYADIALWMQQTVTRGVVALARYALDASASRRLCLAGGVALNVVANRALIDALTEEGVLHEVFIQPAASDTGTPLGAALSAYGLREEGTCPFQKNIAYLGPEPDVHEAERRVVAMGGRLMADPAREVAELLLDERIVGWWQGRSELGPRALGARSILCWARPAHMKDHLNARVKHREAFRPFAPIVLEECAGEIFDAPGPVPYMLVNALVRPAYGDRIPAVTHADGSARLQTVSRERTPELAELLAEVQRRDGVGVLLNTSFNVAGEPIVETIDDAIRCFESTAIDALVAGKALLIKS